MKSLFNGFSSKGSTTSGPPRSKLRALRVLTLLGSVIALAASSMPAVTASAATTPKAKAPRAAAAPSAYTALASPNRIMDTRPAAGGAGPIGFRSSRNLTVANPDGTGPAPADATAVVMNVTVTETTANSFLAVYPAGGTRPLVSNLNWVAGETRPNLVEVPVGDNGQVTFYNNDGSTQVIADLAGYFSPSSSTKFAPLSPSRILDTRTAVGGHPGKMTQGETMTLQVGGQGGVSATAASVVMNFTVTNPDSSPTSFMTIWPADQPQPTVSNLNWVAGETIANRVMVGLGTGASAGKIKIYNSKGNVDVIGDVNGYYEGTASQLLSNVTPTRLKDTRVTGGTLAQQGTLDVQVTGNAGVPTNATAAILNVTATNGTAPSFFTVYPKGDTRPLASDLNFGPNQDVPNLVVVKLGTGGAITIFNNAGTADAVVDIFGYFGPGGPPPVVPLTLSPPTQSKTADGTTQNTPITATAKNADGSPNVGANVNAKVTSGPNAGATDSCVTGVSGTCQLFTGPTALTSNTAGTDTVTALLDTDFDGDFPPDADADGEPSATATITWVAGAVHSLLLEPGGEFTGSRNPNGDSQTRTNYPPSTGGGSTSGTNSAVTNTVGNSELFTVGAYDSLGNPVSGIGITFTDYFGNAAAMQTGTCAPYSGTGSTISGCTVKTGTGTTDANGKATYSTSSNSEGADIVYAVVTAISGITSDGAEVDWGASTLTVTPNYTQADVAKTVGDNSTYTVVSKNGLGVANTNCTSADIYENWTGSTSYTAWGTGPDTDLSDGSGGSHAYFTGVGSGEVAYSDSGCFTPVDFSTATPGEIFFKPDSGTGAFTFTMTSQVNGDSASPFVNSQGNNDFPQNWCDSEYWYCGDVVAGATTVWTAAGAGAYQVSVSPTTATTVAVGGLRTYSESVMVNGHPNTSSSVPNSFSFTQAVSNTASPVGTIDHITYVKGGTTYCVGGFGGVTNCHAVDATHVNGDAPGVTTSYQNYPGCTNCGDAFTEVRVAGQGSFDATITDDQTVNGGKGPATPVGWADLNNNHALDSGEPSANGGTTTFASPTGAGLNVFTYNYAAYGPSIGGQFTQADLFNDNQYYQFVNAAPATTTDYILRAAVVDQSGNAYTGSTQYALKWTVTNNGVAATHVWLNDVSNGDTGAFTDHSVPNYPPFGDHDLGNATTCHFHNPTGAVGNCNGTIAANTAESGAFASTPGSITIPGGASISFIAYTDNTAGCTTPLGSANCGTLVLTSGDVTKATVTAQLADATSGTNIGSSSTQVYNWVQRPTPGSSASGIVVSWDNPNDSAQADADTSRDFAVINTSIGLFLVQFSQSTSSTYTVNGTSATEDQFESALSPTRTYAMTNYGGDPQTNTLTGAGPLAATPKGAASQRPTARALPSGGPTRTSGGR